MSTIQINQHNEHQHQATQHYLFDLINRFLMIEKHQK